jgi:ADP-heptose:LPS heptosyltransferase
MNSSIGNKCVSLSKMNISEIIPIIGSCKYGIFNDTGFAHISSALGLKCLVLFMDSPAAAYGTYSKNISIIVPDGETIESCGHNTNGKDRISFDKVYKKILDIIS